MRKTPTDIENNVINLLQNNYSCRKIAEKLNLSKSTVNDIKKRQNVACNNNQGGRPRLLSDGDARQIERLLHNKDTKTPKNAAKSIGKDVSSWTVRRALNRIGLVASVKKKKPALSDRNVKRRLHFCKTHKNWTVDDWKRVIWSDETKVNRYQSDGKEYYWHRPQERIQKHHVKETMKHGGGSIMVWGCFTWWNIGPLVRIQGIMKKEDYLNILQTNLPEFVDESAYPTEEVVFQQDGDPKHTAKIVKSWLQNQTFGTMEWPAQSPDLNPIENLWAIVKRRLGAYENPPKNVDELWERIQHEWRALDRDIIQKLVESMPKRIESVIKNKGLWTKY